MTVSLPIDRMDKIGTITHRTTGRGAFSVKELQCLIGTTGLDDWKEAADDGGFASFGSD